MSPAFVSAIPAAVNVLGGQQSARTLHFFVSLALVLFLLVHVGMVWLAGFRSRMRAMITGRASRKLTRNRSAHERTIAPTYPANARQPVTPQTDHHRTRRAAGVAGLGVAARLAQKYGLIPPDHGGIYGLGETLTYASQRLLTRHSLAREFSRSQISKPPFAERNRASD